MRTGVTRAREVCSAEGLWYAWCILPFSMQFQFALSVAVTFTDITARISAELAMRDNEHRLAAFVMSNADFVYRMSPDRSQMWQLRGAGRIADPPDPLPTDSVRTSIRAIARGSSRQRGSDDPIANRCSSRFPDDMTPAANRPPSQMNGKERY